VCCGVLQCVAVTGHHYTHNQKITPSHSLLPKVSKETFIYGKGQVKFKRDLLVADRQYEWTESKNKAGIMSKETFMYTKRRVKYKRDPLPRQNRGIKPVLRQNRSLHYVQRDVKRDVKRDVTRDPLH